MGIALSLGRPVVILARQGQAIPFDVDIEPLRLARQQYAAHPNSYVRITLVQIKDSVEKDPLKTAAILDSALAELGTDDQQLVSVACPLGMAYIHGDQVLSPDIIRSIWDEICRASHVVVDLTGLNANALLELGMAHTLGRNVLLLTQDTSRQDYPSMLAKQRLHRYSLEDSTSCQALSDLLGRFLKL